MPSKKKNSAPEDEVKKAQAQANTEEKPAEDTKAGEATAETAAEKAGAAAAESAAPAEDAKQQNEKYIRLMAEYDNFRKRSAKERENIYTDVRIDTITKFLPVYDNLARALATETADEAYKKGVEMTFTQLQEVFKKLGVEEIAAKGEKFDPTVHNAVMHVDDEAFGESEIIEEFQKGFKIGDKVVRFSMVKVAN